MSDLVRLLREGTPCRRVLGHGEYCTNGYECSVCRVRLQASDEVERMERELGELRFAGIALYKWLLTVPHMEPPMARFSIPDEVWEPFQDALFAAVKSPPTQSHNQET